MSEPLYIGSWQSIRRLGGGGQGDVWLARPKEVADRRSLAMSRLATMLTHARGHARDVDQVAETEEFLALIRGLSRDESPDTLGAAKVFNGHVRNDRKALQRLSAEISVLTTIEHPAVIRLLDSDVPSGILVTEYHRRGDLWADRGRFKGDVLASLKALRGLVDGLRALHDAGAIHRDIKPHNVLVAEDGRLIIADFGIAITPATGATRITDAIGERVGSSDWIAPWANIGTQVPIDDMNETFDLFPVGKILWSMVTGRILPYWFWDDPKHDLRLLFPGQSDVRFANDVISRVVVRHEKDCCRSAVELLQIIDHAIAKIEAGARSLDEGGWPCQLCGVGLYRALYDGIPNWMLQFWPTEHAKPNAVQLVRPYVCENCGHLTVICLKGDAQSPKLPGAWETPR
jgi:serine/threonine protein kinase